MRILLPLLLFLGLAVPLSAQCSFNVSVGEADCNESGTEFFFRLQVTGTAEAVRITGVDQA